jgi:hypothetical protein
MFLAPLLVVLVLSTYYWNVKSDCRAQAQLRHKFVGSVEDAGESGQPLRLDALYPTQWEFAKTFQNFQPKHRKRSCPLGWDWSDEIRQELIDSEMMSVIIFFNEGVISHILEFNNARISVDEIDGRATRDHAVFKVDKIVDGQQVHYHLSSVANLSE